MWAVGLVLWRHGAIDDGGALRVGDVLRRGLRTSLGLLADQQLVYGCQACCGVSSGETEIAALALKGV